jgi:glucose/arabinose dehydrogenase
LDNEALALKRCRDVATDGKGLVLILTDENIQVLLKAVADRKRNVVDTFLELEAAKRLN